MAGVAAEDVAGAVGLLAARGRRRIRPLFAQERVAASAGLFLDGLLGPQRSETGWMRAEAAGDPRPWRQQAILGRGRWEADALRDLVREYAGSRGLSGIRCTGGRLNLSRPGLW